MGRSLLHWVCVCVLVALPVVGCSDESIGGTGGSGGSAATGGAGTGGSPATEAVRVAFIGDSITEPVGTAAMPVNYPEHLELLLGDDFELGNFGVGGATMLRTGNVPYWDLPEFASAKALEPHVVTIMLGTNDSKPVNWDATAFEADYRDMIEEMQALSLEPTILLLRPVPVFGVNAFMIRGDVVRDEVLPTVDRLGTEHDLNVIDLYSALLEHGDLFPDAVHPTAEGGRLIAEHLVGPIVNAARARGFAIGPCLGPSDQEAINTADFEAQVVDCAAFKVAILCLINANDPPGLSEECGNCYVEWIDCAVNCGDDCPDNCDDELKDCSGLPEVFPGSE